MNENATKVIVRKDDIDRLEAVIKNRTGSTDTLVFPDDFISEIQNMPDTLEMLVGCELKSYTDYSTAIPSNFIQYNPGIIELNLPNALYINYNAFYMCENLISVNMPNVLSINSGAFSECKSLETVYLPNALSLNGSFKGCINLTDISIPKVTSIAYYTFYNCNFTKLELPSLIKVSSYSISNCENLKTISVSSLENIPQVFLAGCPNFDTFIIKNNNTICTLGTANVFPDSKIASGEGFIYVPDAFVDDYKSATNWSIFADQIKPLSEYVETE